LFTKRSIINAKKKIKNRGKKVRKCSLPSESSENKERNSRKRGVVGKDRRKMGQISGDSPKVTIKAVCKIARERDGGVCMSALGTKGGRD